MPEKKLNRREFIKRASLGALGAGLSTIGSKPASALQNFFSDSDKILDMKYRRLGRTEMMVSEIGMGGTGIASIVSASMDRGVNYVDTAAGYGDGKSEIEIGKAIKGRRKEIYIATKWHTDTHRTNSYSKNITKEILLASLEGSLKRLGTDYVDVIQVHAVSSEWQITTPVLFEAFEQAKRDGKARFTEERKNTSTMASYQRLFRITKMLLGLHLNWQSMNTLAKPTSMRYMRI